MMTRLLTLLLLLVISSHAEESGCSGICSKEQNLTNVDEMVTIPGFGQNPDVNITCGGFDESLKAFPAGIQCEASVLVAVEAGCICQVPAGTVTDAPTLAPSLAPSAATPAPSLQSEAPTDSATVPSFSLVTLLAFSLLIR